MSKVINLNKARKQRAREDAARQAAENRVRFGRSKAEKARDTALEEEARQRMDGLRRDPEEPR